MRSKNERKRKNSVVTCRICGAVCTRDVTLHRWRKLKVSFGANEGLCVGCELWVDYMLHESCNSILS